MLQYDSCVAYGGIFALKEFYIKFIAVHEYYPSHLYCQCENTLVLQSKCVPGT